MDCDAVVVGGGFAGITAARELQSRGLQTVLLEARDRLGGRTWTVDFAGERVEMGGTWVHWRQPHVWAELTRYGLSIEDYTWDWDVALFGSPPRRYPPEEAFAKVHELASRYASDADRAALPRPFDPLHNASALFERDRLSIEDRLDEMGLSPSDREWIPGSLRAHTAALRWQALSGWDNVSSGDELRYRPVGGTVAILEGILSDARLPDGGVEVRLSSPVCAVEGSEDRVRVTTRSGEVVSASVGVMAVPVNVWPTIEFSPALPSSHREAPGDPVNRDKVFVHVRADIGRVFAQFSGPEPLGSFRTFKHYGDTQLIMGFNHNPSLDVTDKQQVAETICQHLPEIEEVLDSRGHSWGADQYARGEFPPRRPGQLTHYLVDFQRPLGRLAFASSDIALGYHGNIDGAIESGLRAARTCLQAAGPEMRGAPPVATARAIGPV
jgi:nicotine oxidoreductase